MTKQEAIELFVQRDFNAIPTDWVKIVADKQGVDIGALPMWGTMWFVDKHVGEKLLDSSRVMVSCEDEIDREHYENKNDLSEYVNEEMAGERCVLDKDGNTTPVYIYEIEGEYLIGINGAGWDFYHGVWDVLYDLSGLEWHK